MIKTLDNLSRFTAWITSSVIVVMAAVMMTSLILQVFWRYFLGSALNWAEELALILFTWVTLLAATTALRDGAHVRLDFLIKLLPAPLSAILEKVISLAVFLFCILFAWSGYEYTVSTIGQVTAAMRTPVEVLHLAAPVCGVLGALHALVRLFHKNTPQTTELIG